MGLLPVVKGAEPPAAPAAPVAQQQTRAPGSRRGGRSSVLPGSKPIHSDSLMQRMPKAMSENNLGSSRGKRPASKPARKNAPARHPKDMQQKQQQQQHDDARDTPGLKCMSVPSRPVPQGAFDTHELRASAGDSIPSKIQPWKAPMNLSYCPRPDLDPVLPSIARGKALLATEEQAFKGTSGAAPSFMKRKKISPVDPNNQFSTSFRVRNETEPSLGALPPLPGPHR
jgi:hypothetical protein